MSAKKFLSIIGLNILGAALFLSWYLPADHGFWFAIDKSVFYFFNSNFAHGKHPVCLDKSA